MNKYLLWTIRHWHGYKLPLEHVFIDEKNKPRETRALVRVYFRKWLVHPFKRRVAKYYLIFLQKFFGIKVVGITGSAGKTTVKEMLAGILSRKGETIASFKNIDPAYNIPTTILQCRPSTKFLVLEMGVEYPGEMDYYTWLANSDVGIVTNIYPTHTQFFKNEEGVAKEKGKLISFLKESAHGVLNSDNKYCLNIAKTAQTNIILFGSKGQIKANSIKYTCDFQTKFKLKYDRQIYDVTIPLVGEQFVWNALAASSAALALGMEMKTIVKGLSNFETPEHRMRIFKHKSGALILDDAYNNNPKAAESSLKVFDTVAKANNKNKIIVFGDMLELGEKEKQYHREIGNQIAKLNPLHVIAVGSCSKVVQNTVSRKIGNNKVTWFAKSDGVHGELQKFMKRENAIFFKASRSIGLEKVVSNL